jgi:uroporphyrinogen-III synthase
LPLIEVAPPLDAQPVRDAWATLAERRLVVFVSPNAVEQFFACRPATVVWPRGVDAGSTGPGTSRALLRLGVPATALVAPDARAPQFDSEALWAQLAPRDWHGARVLIVRGEGGRDWLAETLRRHGARVDHVAAYRRLAPTFTPAQLEMLAAAVAEPPRYLWLFSSSEAIDNLDRVRPGSNWSAARAVATHPRIAQRARQLGFGSVTQASPVLNAVVACLQSIPS